MRCIWAGCLGHHCCPSLAQTQSLVLSDLSHLLMLGGCCVSVLQETLGGCCVSVLQEMLGGRCVSVLPLALDHVVGLTRYPKSPLRCPLVALTVCMWGHPAEAPMRSGA